MRSGRYSSAGLGDRRAHRRWRFAVGSCWRRLRDGRARRSRPSWAVAGSTVGKWRGRFARRGIDGLHDEPRPGKPRSISDADVERVIVKTLEEQPANATHWSTRSLAAATGMSQSAISRIWRAFGLKPHQTEAFKLSPDPQFIDKVRDVVGLYLNPPEAAVVLCVDEKSQIQALDRSAPVLPLLPGVPARQTHDYVRNGITNLYAALDVASGQVIAEMTPRHRAEEFRRFLNLIDSSVPAHLAVHVVLDNSSTHKTPSIQRWLVLHPRFTLHLHAWGRPASARPALDGPYQPLHPRRRRRRRTRDGRRGGQSRSGARPGVRGRARNPPRARVLRSATRGHGRRRRLRPAPEPSPSRVDHACPGGRQARARREAVHASPGRRGLRRSGRQTAEGSS